jgi:protein involved in polysaccharide export with SLBB domain
LAALAGLPLVVGCEVDSYINPSITGRWENTPTIVPILERLGMVEDQSGELVEYSDVTPEDLVPDAEPYRLGAGDALRITLVDDITRGQQSEYDRTVDTRGFIDLPQLGQIQLAGLTVEQAREAMQASLGRLVSDPVVGLDVVQQRNQTFTVVGAVEQPGPFFLPRADYRLLEAITSAGRFQESVQYVYLIRQVALDESVTRGGIPPSRSSKSPESSGDGSTTPASDAADTPAAPSSPDDFLKTIDRLSQPEGSTGGATPPAEAPKAEPQSTEPQNAELAPAPAPAPAAAPAEAPEPVIDLPDAAMAPKPAVFGRGYQPDTAPSREPMVDLPDSAGSGPVNPEPVSGDASAPSSGNWVYVNGRWVQAARAGGEEAGNGGKNKGLLMTQRIIRIPSNALMAGDAKYNIVVRPGDVLRVPPPPNGVVYVDGQVQRPGVYNLPESGRLTLQRVITAAGGYGEQAIPERMDITRMLPGDRQAIVRLDGRAIAEGTQPDIYLKPDDRVNVGSNFWALPLAVIRNGFRMSYGFGFLIDRNFGNDIFGPPPDNNDNGF